GIDEKGQFSIKDVDAELIVLEIMGVYCSLCHKQRPHINRLFHRVNKNADLSKKVKFLGIAAGATPMEVAYYVKQSKVPYPVLPDEKFVIHKKLDQPRTPYNMVVTKDGQILYAHLGVIEDMDIFFATLKEMAGKVPSINK
ncbi:MAG: redoxin domain-containing protein, partial [Proteobacteria bacterium]|nr:redoxin domain-containing protein [Pseudomonadota bacterium]